MININSLSLAQSLQTLVPRSRTARKGDFGHVLVVGGDDGFGGSVRLAGEAALRSGAGLVSIATRPEHAYAITGNCPELMCRGVRIPEDLDALIAAATVIVVGPGLGQGDWGKLLWLRCLQAKQPLVVDADALNLLAHDPIKRDNWILTPHPGEAGRLLKKTISEIQQDRLFSIQSLQQQYQGISILKGAGTLILGEKGSPVICMAGNPGMSVAGMGDVLSGIIAALIAQGLRLQEAAELAVVVHAVAGDKAALQSGERGMKASDLFPYIREILNA